MTDAARVQAECPPTADLQAQSRGARIDSIDLLRGLVMIVMALDHTREYFHAAVPGLDATDPVHSSGILYATRWVTYFCAPTFVFLSGVSAWLRGQSCSRSELSRFLATRGVWLILLELTIVGTAFTFHPGFLFLQVIWVIGAGFLVLSLLCRFPSIVPLLLGLAIVAGHDLLQPFRGNPAAPAPLLFSFLDGGFAFVEAGPLRGVLLYSALGWVGIMLAGYGMGPLFRLPPERRRRLLMILGGFAVAAFLLLRFLNRYGDPFPWSPQPSLSGNLMAFLRVSKYPPSLDFTLATLGPMLLLLPWLERLSGRAASAIRTYGRVPFFYYILHIYLIHGAAAVAGLAQGMSFSSFTDPLNPPAGFGIPLGGVYVLWAVVVLILYVPCRWFEQLRRRRSDWWLSYL
jgi:uncharacterized membrane protein